LPKFFLIHIIIFFIFSCEKSSIIEIPNNVIFSNNIHLSIDGKFLLYKNKKFSGYLEEISSNNIRLSRIGYYNGRKEGIEKIWYDNNKISEIRFYRKGKKIGVHELFWDNGNKKMIAYFKNGEHNGEMTQWHKNGKVYKKFNYKSGFEEGNQKIWNDKGNLKANYDVIQGRRYGLTGIKNCKSVNNVY